MSLEWFDRVCGDLQEHLESICVEYDQIGQMSIERSAKHPRIEFFIEVADVDTEELIRDYFCTLFFDPENEEFYVHSFDVDSGHNAKIILSDIEEIIDEVHDSLHEYINEDDYLEDDYLDDEDTYHLEESIHDGGEVNLPFEETYMEEDDEEYYEAVQKNNDIFEEIDVEWSTPEVTAFMHEDEVEVTYQFGVIQETGDGVLKRINRIWTTDEELLKDESHFIFSKEEASTIIAMIASHMDQLSDFHFENGN